VHHDINIEAITNLMHKYLYSYNITILYMFRTLLCSPSAGKIVYVQHIRNIRPLTCFQSDGTRCCTYTIWPPEDERNNARNM